MRLLNSVATPFWGSQVRPLPPLDDGYVAHQLEFLRQQKPELGTVRHSVLKQVFEHLHKRCLKVIG